MKTPKSTYLKIYHYLQQHLFGVITAEQLADVIGIYPNAIREAMVLFYPMIFMDLDANLVDLLPQLETYLFQSTTKHKKKIAKKEKTYDSLQTFIYEKMTVGGILDKSIELSEADLKIAKQLIQQALLKVKK